MPVDASIYGGIQPAKPRNVLADYAQALQVRGLQQEGELGALKMDEYRRGVDEQNALTQAMRAEGFSLDSPEHRNALLRVSPTKGMALIKQHSDMRKDGLTADKTAGEVVNQRISLYRDNIGGVNDPQTAVQFVTTLYNDPALRGSAITAVPLEKLLAGIPQDPAQLGAWKQQFALGATKFMEMNAPKVETRNLGGTTQTFSTAPLTGEVRVLNTAQNTQSPESIASNATTQRGQNLTDKRARDFNEIQQDANNIKRDEKKAVQDLTKNSQIASMDTMLGTLDRLSAHPGLSRSVGVVGAFPTMPGSQSANFQAELNTFQSQAFIPMVAQLKGMGALSDAEGKKLTAAVGALDPKMGEEAFRASVSRIIEDMEAARERLAGSRRTPKSSGGATGSWGAPAGGVIDFGSLK